MGRCILVLGCALAALFAEGLCLAAPAEFNPISRSAIAIGPEAVRLIVGFRASASGAVHEATVRRGGRSYRVVQAWTHEADARSLADRTGLTLAKTRQLTPSMHVLLLPRTLYGADLVSALARLRADPQVEFAAVDGRRHALGSVIPNDPNFTPNLGSWSGQWYLGAPTPANTMVTLEGGVQTTDLSATDAVDAWGMTEGSAGVVIADVDTGVRFDHPDLLRAGQGGRLLPGYDFVGEDYSPNSPFNALGTYLIANDGDGWDPDPSDPGDWIDSTDIANPNKLFATDTASPSSWHGTRVVGVYGALTNNSVGVAGMTWSSWILPVRALGKGGGYDSDIVAGIEWAAGMTVYDPEVTPQTEVPANPYPADIINLSIGGSPESCSGTLYESALTSVTQLGVLVVIAAGNANDATELPVNLPATCAGSIPGVMAVAGLRNVGTKVGYSSFGSQVSVAAPAGNCLNLNLPCLRSIDSTTNIGQTIPDQNSYTDEMNPNLGTSFATPIVSGIAGLMRAANNNLTPAQLAARIEGSATPFPAPGAVPICTSANGLSECSCGPSQCGTGMANAYSAVQAAQRPIAAVAVPATIAAGSNAVFDASGSVAACNHTVASYSWVSSGTVKIISATGPSVTILPGSGTLTLTVTDDVGNMDIAAITVTASSASSSAPTSAGAAGSACPTPIDPTPTPPTITQSFSPVSVSAGVMAALTITFTNANGFALTQSSFTQALPNGLSVASSPAPTTSCSGAQVAVTSTASTVTLSGAVIPANGRCSVTVSVSSSAVGTYTSTVAANALVTAPAGGNAAANSTALTVSAPPSGGGGGGGGGSLDWLDLGIAALLLAVTRRAAHRFAGIVS